MKSTTARKLPKKRTSPARNDATVTRARSGPVRVVLPPDVRDQISAEAHRRGLGISPALRVLVMERLGEIAADELLGRAERWQRAQAWATFEQTRARGTAEVSRADLAATFVAARTRAQTVAKHRR